MSLTEDLVTHLDKIDRGSLTSDDVDAMRRLLLDHLAVVANGALTDSAVAARRFAARFDAGAGPPFPLIGTGDTAPPLVAAMANAVAGHSIEYDDVHNAASSHPGVVVFPAALAAAALTASEGDDFLVAVVVGYEVMCRVGRAVHPPAHYGRHFHPTGTTGHFGAAAAAASLLGLDREATISALGIAATMAAGSMEFLTDGAWTKRLHPALAARNGVEAALLAADGFIGPHDGIGGSRGFLSGYSADARPEELLAQWDERSLEVHNTSIKAHACCRYNQGAIDCLLEIRRLHSLDPGSVASVVIGLPSVAVDIVAEPRETKIHPRSVVDAQFSLPFAAAVALAHGRAGLGEYTDAVLRDRAILDLMARIGYETDAEIDAHYPEQWRAWATVTTMEGRSFTARVDDPKGDPANPLRPEEVRGKFDELTAAVYDPEDREAIAEEALSIGDSGSLRSLVLRLGGRGRS